LTATFILSYNAYEKRSLGSWLSLDIAPAF
jgi:hypothetical protein